MSPSSNVDTNVKQEEQINAVSEAPRVNNNFREEAEEYNEAVSALRKVVAGLSGSVSLLDVVDMAHELAPRVPLEALGASAFDLAGQGIIDIDLASRVSLPKQD